MNCHNDIYIIYYYKIITVFYLGSMIGYSDERKRRFESNNLS